MARNFVHGIGLRPILCKKRKNYANAGEWYAITFRGVSFVMARHRGYIGLLQSGRTVPWKPYVAAVVSHRASVPLASMRRAIPSAVHRIDRDRNDFLSRSHEIASGMIEQVLWPFADGLNRIRRPVLSWNWKEPVACEKYSTYYLLSLGFCILN